MKKILIISLVLGTALQVIKPQSQPTQLQQLQQKLLLQQQQKQEEQPLEQLKKLEKLEEQIGKPLALENQQQLQLNLPTKSTSSSSQPLKVSIGTQTSNDVARQTDDETIMEQRAKTMERIAINHEKKKIYELIKKDPSLMQNQEKRNALLGNVELLQTNALPRVKQQMKISEQRFCLLKSELKKRNNCSLPTTQDLEKKFQDEEEKFQEGTLMYVEIKARLEILREIEAVPSSSSSKN